MKISLRWLNEYLAPGNLSAEEAEHALTFAGFPIESAEQVAGGDTCLDVEVTSNRGDVLSHVGVAREIAAATGRALRPPAPDAVFNWSDTPTFPPGPTGLPDAGDLCSVDNLVPDTCRLFTAQVIRGVKVGPSPRWLVEALAAVGQRSINNVVDVTNFVALELGQPTHVFDLATIAPDGQNRAGLIVRQARKGEALKLLDGRTVTLAGDELVVADRGGGQGAGEGRVVSLAGVMGGADTEVSERTTDVVLEAATWEPVAVRRAARRFNIRTDASYRFERIVDPRTIEAAARRAAALIVRLAGGLLAPGIVKAGPSAPPSPPIRLRSARVAQMLGTTVPASRIADILRSLEITCEPAGDDGRSGAVFTCTPPAFRPDLTREIDLIEEVARIHGLDKLPVSETVAVRVAPPQTSETAMRELARVLTGLGFYEALTFTFVSQKGAKPFLPKGMTALMVCDERRKADPVLRPSILPGLLASRRINQDGGVAGEGAAGIRLFETAAVFAEVPPAGGTKGVRGQALQTRNLALLTDASFPEGGKAVDRKQAAVRIIRGAIEAAVHALGGGAVAGELRFAPPEDGFQPLPAFDPAACGVVYLRGKMLGTFGLIADSVGREYDLSTPVAAAELELDALLDLYPPRSLVHALPQFPSIERDLSLIVAEQTRWAAIEQAVGEVRASGAMPLMESMWFVTTYRGQPVPSGRKSVTFRMRFRDPADQRTLRHEEVDPQVAALVDHARKTLGAELRA